jgi:hypothetical protein
MATGRIRRTAMRGIAVAVLGWLLVAAGSVLMAPSAAAAPSATVEIRNFTPPVASVDKGGQVTFVNAIPAQNRGGISLPLLGSVSATVYTDVAVTFFGQTRQLQPGQSAAWNFPDPATTGYVTYTYRIVPQAGLALDLVDQVVNTVASQLPAAPVNVSYIVQTIAPAVPNLPSVNLPQLPQVAIPALPLPAGQVPTPGAGVPTPTVGGPAPTAGAPTGGPLPASTPGDVYTYSTDLGGPRMSPSDVVAAAAFDPARFFVPGSSLGGADRAGARSGGGAGGGAGGVAGTYDGASVPVFGQLAGLDSTALDEADAATQAADRTASAPTLPAAALAAVVALAAVTAALVRTHQESRGTR